jgi:hypothetical protein
MGMGALTTCQRPTLSQASLPFRRQGKQATAKAGASRCRKKAAQLPPLQLQMQQVLSCSHVLSFS